MKENKKQNIWESLSQEEKLKYLAFWFNYYGGAIYTLEEYEAFLNIAKLKVDIIYEHICSLYIYKNTIQSTTLLVAIRQNKVDDLLKANITEENIKALKISDDKKVDLILYLYEVKNMIIKEIIKAFNNPEPSNYYNKEKTKSKK